MHSSAAKNVNNGNHWRNGVKSERKKFSERETHRPGGAGGFWNDVHREPSRHRNSILFKKKGVFLRREALHPGREYLVGLREEPI